MNIPVNVEDATITLQTLRDMTVRLSEASVPAYGGEYRVFVTSDQLEAVRRMIEADERERAANRERQRDAREAHRERILVRLDNPTDEDRAEAAEMAAWMKRTLGDVLPLPR